MPLSGIAATYAPVSAAANAVFKWVNAHGGVNGRKIKYIRLDDCYDLAAYGLGCTAGASVTTLSQNQVLVAQDHVFATVGSLGTAAEESVESYLKQNGVPQLFVNSGSKAWDDPSQYPDLFGYQTSYNAEGKIFAHFIKTHFAGETVGFIGQNDDFGANGLLGLQDGGVSIASANNLTYNAADAVTGSSSDIQADVGTLAANKVQVVVLDSVPGFTTGILEVAHALGYSPTWIISSVGADPTSVNYAGEAGAYTLDYFPSVTDTGDPWIPWIRKVLMADKSDFPSVHCELDPERQRTLRSGLGRRLRGGPQGRRPYRHAGWLRQVAAVDDVRRSRDHAAEVLRLQPPGSHRRRHRQDRSQRHQGARGGTSGQRHGLLHGQLQGVATQLDQDVDDQPDSRLAEGLRTRLTTAHHRID